MNSLMVIFPYKRGAIWAFDDDQVGLKGEPFVGAINLMIDALASDIPNAEEGISITFSANPFPGSSTCIERTISDLGGNWYTVIEAPVEEIKGVTGWLCPALFKYFTEAPDRIYVKVDPMAS